MVKGSCLCGDVQIEVSGKISSIIHCHCSLCRKSSGTAYATNGFVDADALVITQGAAKLNFFELKPGKKRHFCQRCASPIYSTNADDPSRVRLRLGVLDDDIDERPMSHNFVTSKANWDCFDAPLPQYNKHEPGR